MSVVQQEAEEIEKMYFEMFKEISLSSSHLYQLEMKKQPLDKKEYQNICQWISGEDTAITLISKFNIDIKRFDIQSLFWDPLQWLNDKIINFYMELIVERSRLNKKLPSVYAMNTNFFTNLMLDYSYVRSWTKKVDIFSFDIILVPVHDCNHWSIVSINTKNKSIKHYNSTESTTNKVLNELVEYLKSESIDKQQVPIEMSGWTIENAEGIPQQTNGSDCGVFSCMYAEIITKNQQLEFTQHNMIYQRMKMVYEICTGEILT